MHSKRRELIEESLHKDLFKMADDIVVNVDPNDYSSTEKLANILDGYITKVENLHFEDENEEFEILDSKDLEIEVDEKDIVKAYSNHIHEFNNDTFGDLLNIEDTKDVSKVDIDMDYEDDFETEHTQTIVSPVEIKEFDSSEIEMQEEKNEVKEEDSEESDFEMLDVLLILAVVVLVIVLFFIFVKG